MGSQSVKQLVWLGCGDLAAQFLTTRGSDGFSHKVGLRRQAERVPEGFDAISGDLTQPQVWASLLEDHCSAVWVITLTPRQRTEAGYHDGYCLPMQSLKEALIATPKRPERVVFVSSTSVYGQNSGECVTESSETQPTGFNGQQLVCAEHIFADLPWGNQTAITRLRLGGIYGKGRSRLLKKVFQASDASQLAPFHTMTNRVHSHDAAAMIAHLLTVPRIQPVYIGCDPHSTEQRVVFQSLSGMLADALQEALSNRSMSTEGRQALVRRCRDLSHLADQLLHEPECLANHLSGKRCLPDALMGEGFAWRYPDFRSGYQTMVTAFVEAVLDEREGLIS